MKKNIIRFISLATAFILVIGVTACDNTEPTTGTSESGSESAEKITISFKSYFTEGENAEAISVAYHQIMDEFLAENSDVELDEELLAHDAYETKMMALHASESLPDMFQLKAQWVKTFNDNDQIGEMDAFLDADTEWRSGFVEGAFEEFKIDGKTYGIPYQLATVTNLFYNKGIFDECGITTFPTNLEEFEAAIVTLKEKGYIPITAGNLGGWFLDVCFFRGILDRYAGSEWSVNLEKNTGSKFTDDVFVDALEQFKRIADMDAFNDDLNSIDYMQMRNHFYNREAAMMFDGSGGILPFSQEAPAEILAETEITVLPELTGGKSIGTPGTAGWSLGYNSKVTDKQKPIVGEILKALSSEKHAGIIAANNGFPAVNPGDYDKSKLSSLTIKYNTMLETVPITTLANLQPSVLQVLYDGLQEIMIGAKTPQELANALQTEMDALE